MEEEFLDGAFGTQATVYMGRRQESSKKDKQTKKFNLLYLLYFRAQFTALQT